MGRINFNNDVQYDTDDKKFKLTRGMLIVGASVLVGIIILIIIIVSVINSNKKDKITEAEFLKLESRMEEEASLYVFQKQIILDENPYKIPLKELLTENSGTIDSSKNPAARVCDGYVIAKKIDSEIYDAYISCGDMYETSGYVSNDSVEKTTTTKRKKDTEKPNLILIGDKNITLRQGDIYTEPGYSAIDNIDKDITSKVVVAGNVDTSVAGEYNLKYTVSDSSGNVAEERRVIKVIGSTTTTRPTTTQIRTTTTRRVTTTTTKKVTTTKKEETPKIPPTITLYGSRIITLYVGDKYKDPGYSAKDCMGADITTSVIVSGAVNTKVATTYYITYSVTDKYGNKSVATRTIIVKTKVIPVEGISISPNYVELQKGQTKKLEVYINPSNATNKKITWTSSNNSIATISNGVVTANAKGVAIITATTTNGKSYSVRVEVK